jgi:hypothetical protein
MTATRGAHEPIARLRDKIACTFIEPSEVGYDAARRTAERKDRSAPTSDVRAGAPAHNVPAIQLTMAGGAG